MVVGSRGNIRGFLFVLFVVVVALGAVALLISWYLRVPEQVSVPPTHSTGTPTTSGFKGDPAEATEKILKALNQKLQSLDLLKLLSQEVISQPVTVQDKVFSTYTEVFRLPLRYSVDEIAGQLNETAKSLGAQMRINGWKGTYSFMFSPEWTPIEISFAAVTKPRICLIIDDGGYKKGETLEHLYGFKVPVTLAIIPDVEFSKSLAEELPGHGVEVMCHMPMEGHEKGTVGGAYKELLKKGMGASKAQAEVEKALDGLPNCRGLNNHMGSVATTDPELMWDVCQVLKSRNLFIIDSRTTAESVVEKVAQKAHVPVTHRDVFLDNVETPEAILKQLDQLAARAKKHGLAVGIGHFKLVTLKTLEKAVQRLKDEGIQFVYASEVVKEE